MHRWADLIQLCRECDFQKELEYLLEYERAYFWSDCYVECVSYTDILYEHAVAGEIPLKLSMFLRAYDSALGNRSYA